MKLLIRQEILLWICGNFLVVSMVVKLVIFVSVVEQKIGGLSLGKSFRAWLAPLWPRRPFFFFLIKRNKNQVSRKCFFARGAFALQVR
nr:hypothetical protein [uncultured Mucilaginibacter sp.]